MRHLFILLAVIICLSGCGQEPSPPTAPVQEISMSSMDSWHRGVTAWQHHQFKTAETLFDEAIAKDPNNFHAYADRGLMQSLRGHYEKGHADLQKALSLAPQNAAVHYNLAMHYKLQNQYEQARQEFAFVLSKEPKHTWSLYGLATIAADLDEREEALKYLQQAIQTDEGVKNVAREQDHFQKFHGDPTFEALTAPTS